MKTEEDEAFEDIERRQGGGFKAKQAMAADKLQEPTSYLHTVLNAFGPDEGISLDQKTWSQLHAAIKAALAQPAQEPMFWYRPVGEDGGYEGPIHNSSIEEVRKKSGAWVPLVSATPPLPLPAQPTTQDK